MLGKGLPNLGNTCYINSILQCLRYSKSFVKNIIKHDTSKDKLLISSFMNCLYAETTLGDLKDFIHELSQTATEFKLLKQCDAHELYLFIIDKFYEEHKEYVNPFKGDFKSTIHLQCGHTSVTNHPFISLSLTLSDQNVCRMIDNFSKTEVLSDTIMCDTCNIKQQANKEIEISTYPEILTVHLKRFTSVLSKDHTEIDISPEMMVGHHKYMLYAMCNHVGTVCSGHYTATCRKKSGFWIVCNDNSISDLTSLVSKSSTPYILFYKKVL